MESTANSYLKCPPGTREALRKLYNMDKPFQLDEAIKILEEWIKKQNHFVKKNFSRGYLERTLIVSKGSVERAKARIDKTCTLRTLMPKFYAQFQTKEDLKELMSSFKTVLLPNFAEDYYRVLMIKLDSDSEPTRLLNLYKFMVILAEFVRANVYLNGVITIADIRDINLLEFVKSVNLYELRQVSSLIMEGFGLRVKSIHLVSSSAAVDVAVTLIKQVLSAKMSDRIVVHKNIESVATHVPKDILPVEYGGSENTLDEIQDECFDMLSSEHHVQYMQDVQTFVTDEKHRQTDHFNDQYLGIPGTFRALRVD